jgi:hypothetical protein
MRALRAAEQMPAVVLPGGRFRGFFASDRVAVDRFLVVIAISNAQ